MTTTTTIPSNNNNQNINVVTMFQNQNHNMNMNMNMNINNITQIPEEIINENKDDNIYEDEIIAKHRNILNIMHLHYNTFAILDNITIRSSIAITNLENIMEDLLNLPKILNDDRMTRLNNILKQHNNNNINNDLTDYRQNLINWIYEYIAMNFSLFQHLKDKTK
jgi:hypothetical protein